MSILWCSRWRALEEHDSIVPDQENLPPNGVAIRLRRDRHERRRRHHVRRRRKTRLSMRRERHRLAGKVGLQRCRRTAAHHGRVSGTWWKRRTTVGLQRQMGLRGHRRGEV